MMQQLSFSPVENILTVLFAAAILGYLLYPCSDPSKVFKGKKMPGQMGHVKVTVQNLEVVRVDAENNLLLVKGAVPGAKKCLVTIKETVKAGK